MAECTKISNLCQQYLQKIAVVDDPQIDTVTMNKSITCHIAKLQSESDIDQHLDEIKQKFMQKLDGYDVLHIIRGEKI